MKKIVFPAKHHQPIWGERGFKLTVFEVRALRAAVQLKDHSLATLVLSHAGVCLLRRIPQLSFLEGGSSSKSFLNLWQSQTARFQLLLASAYEFLADSFFAEVVSFIIGSMLCIHMCVYIYISK